MKTIIDYDGMKYQARQIASLASIMRLQTETGADLTPAQLEDVFTIIQEKAFELGDMIESAQAVQIGSATA